MHTFKKHMQRIYRFLAIIILILLPLLLLCIGLTVVHFYGEKNGTYIKAIPVVEKIKTKLAHNKVVIKPEDYNEITLKKTTPVYIVQQPVVQPVVQRVSSQDKVVLVVMKNQRQQKKKVAIVPKKKIVAKKAIKVNKKVEQKEVNVTRGSISIENDVKQEVAPETVFVKDTTIKEIVKEEPVEIVKEVKPEPVPVQREVKKRKLVRKAPVEEVVEKKPCTTCKKKQNVETTILIETDGDYEIVEQPRVVDSVVVPAGSEQKVVETVKRVVS
ncbi:MAG: hypothetical protein IJT14_03545 [Rickettsiales bacterium]|nr:hypothetical protein [Rickettsiales bacterium]